MELLKSLIIVSEKAANIARLCRQEEKLFELLVQEKSDSESNPRFVQDFKTLADVLIQETVKHDICKQFPEMENNIYGEEDNIFKNNLGETICVQIKNNVENTIEILQKILNGNTEVAEILANEVHGEIKLDNVNTTFPVEDFNLDCSTLGMWIDPIDSTSEYIVGKEEKHNSGIYTKGLKCVTVLLGIFCKRTGCPVIGVVNQPFYHFSDCRWQGRCLWGVTINRTNSLPPVVKTISSRTVCLSSSEDKEIKRKLLENNFLVVEAAGAGYKLLLVILGLADAYILSKGTTFMWDTCGCQAILVSLGGDVVNCYGTQSSVIYKSADSGENKIEVCCNSDGIIAARSEHILSQIKEIIKNN